MRSPLSAVVFFALLSGAGLQAQPAPPHVEIRTASGQTTYHLGERIPLTLSFTGPAETYSVTLRSPGREDMLALDSIHISPRSGWSDSLAIYVAVTPLFCCGQIATGKISPEPTNLTMSLNEWARFDEPGTYTVSLITHRVSPGNGDRSAFQEALALTSNAIELQIIPATPQWQQATLQHALHELKQPHIQYEPTESRTEAISDLRYLASPQAAEWLAAAVSDKEQDVSYEASLGLVGLPAAVSETALTTMNRLIGEPGFAVSKAFLEAMVWLHHPDTIPPPAPFSPVLWADEQATEKAKVDYMAFARAHQAAVTPVFDAAWNQIALATALKTEPARSVTAQTLLHNRPTHPAPTANAQLGVMLRERFAKLSKEEKTALLRDEWDVIGDRSLLPQLKSLAIVTAEEAHAWEQDGRTAQARLSGDDPLRPIALKRWYQFEPDEAMREIARQIGTAHPQLLAEDLAYLPPTTFPQFEYLWAKSLVETDDFSEANVLGPLLVRFGTGVASAQVSLIVTRDDLASQGNKTNPAVAYLLRFDKPAARRYLQQNAMSLSDIAKFGDDPILHEAALANLDSTNISNVRGALNYLAAYSTGDDRKTVLDSFLKWFDIASAKPATEVKTATDDEYDAPRPEPDLRSLGDDYTTALLAGQGWLADAALFDTVKSHCLEEEVCHQVDRLAKPLLTIGVNHWESRPGPSFEAGHVGQIPTVGLLEAKLDQYPSGTTFTFEEQVSKPNSDSEDEALLAELLEKHGMKLHVDGNDSHPAPADVTQPQI